MATSKKSLADKPEPEATMPVRDDSDADAGLTDRQRTKLEKRDAAVAEAGEDDSKCDNHPDADSVVTIGGELHSEQSLCEECARRNGVAVPSP